MEISGVGGTYRESIDTLRFYGYNPYFVELHNVIDNASTGHTAMAREAIKLHLDEVGQEGGEPMVQAHWERVWSGFLALKPQGVRQGRSRSLFRKRRRAEPAAPVM